MSSPSLMHPAAHAPAGPMPGSLVLLLATGAGLSVASIYYSQPLLGNLAGSLRVSTAQVGLIPTLTQLGYALGILFLAPLGDRHDRRRLIAIKAVVLSLALLACGLAPGIGTLMLASLFVGIAATLAQDIVPAAATLAPDAQRGRIIGTVMTGLLLGILLSRVVSGWVAEQFDWRAVFVLAAVAVAAIGLAAWRGLPRFAPTTTLGYAALLKSMAGLWRRYPALRRAAWAQALLSVAFSAFWSTLALVLAGPDFGQGSAVAGAFGLAGAAGALAAPLAGGMADRRGPQAVIRVAALLVFLSFAVQALAPASLVLLVGVAVVFDLGVQAALVSHQSVIYSLDPASRSRLNAILVSSMFVGMASGAALGSALLAAFGWRAVPVLGTVAALGALVITRRR